MLPHFLQELIRVVSYSVTFFHFPPETTFPLHSSYSVFLFFSCSTPALLLFAISAAFSIRPMPLIGSFYLHFLIFYWYPFPYSVISVLIYPPYSFPSPASLLSAFLTSSGPPRPPPRFRPSVLPDRRLPPAPLTTSSFRHLRCGFDTLSEFHSELRRRAFACITLQDHSQIEPILRMKQKFSIIFCSDKFKFYQCARNLSL